jgi:ribulose-5-phosphate 4-epimerase/fuculose-1-phosphate aldolase
VHLHSTYTTALSCLEDTNPEDAIPAISPYVVMRVGRVPLLPYTRPGSAEVKPLVLAKASGHAAVLLANHGPVVSARTFRDAVFAAEELEETAKLVLLTRGFPVRRLTPQAIRDLESFRR